MTERPPLPADPPLVADERTTLEAFLDLYRGVLMRKLAGVDDDAARAPRTPTGMSLGGIVRHMAGVEQWWFVEVLTGGAPAYDWTEAEFAADRDCDWHLDERHTVEYVLAYYARACDEARAAAATKALEDTVPDPHPRQPGDEFSLRWIYVHMIEEAARHAGHADIFREQIDGATGD